MISKVFRLGWAELSASPNYGPLERNIAIDALLLHVECVSSAASQIQLLRSFGIPIYLTAKAPASRDRKNLQRNRIRSLDPGLFRITPATILIGSEGWPTSESGRAYEGLAVWLDLAASDCKQILLPAWEINPELRAVLRAFCTDHPALSVKVLCPKLSEVGQMGRVKNLHVQQIAVPFPEVEILPLTISKWATWLISLNRQ